MADSAGQLVKAPWHLWVVGGISLLWNAMGALDFTMTEARNEAYLKNVTADQLAYIAGFPIWAVAAWAVGTWGSVLGSLLLLFRRALAVHLFVASLGGLGLTTVYNYVLSDGLNVMGGAGALVFSGVIWVVAVLLLIYARALRRRGGLR